MWDTIIRDGIRRLERELDQAEVPAQRQRIIKMIDHKRDHLAALRESWKYEPLFR